MLQLRKITSVSAAKNYYPAEAAEPGVWFGRGAAALGLEGVVGGREYNRLCDNRHPFTAEKMTPRENRGRVVLWDFNLSPVKSFAVAVSLSPDRDRLMAAGRDAALYAMTVAEELAFTRVRTGGRSEDRHVGAFVGALRTHEATRPVRGEEDPGWHYHATVLNMARDPAEGRYKALKIRENRFNAPLVADAFHQRLRANVEALGYKTRPAPHAAGWELKGVPPSVLAKCSNRSSVIRETAAALAAKLGALSRRKKGTLGKVTREPKRPGLSPVTARDGWRARLTAGERAKLDTLLAPHKPAWQERMQRLRQAVWFKARQQDKQPRREVTHEYS